MRGGGGGHYAAINLTPRAIFTRSDCVIRAHIVHVQHIMPSAWLVRARAFLALSFFARRASEINVRISSGRKREGQCPLVVAREEGTNVGIWSCGLYYLLVCGCDVGEMNEIKERIEM